MKDLPNLFDHFAVFIPERLLPRATDMTEQEDDPYDVPGDGLGFVHTPVLELGRETLETREDGDTYDEDSNGLALSLTSFEMGTALTASNETFDDDKSIAALGCPHILNDETSLTKTLGDTFDDQSIDTLAHPLP